MNQCACLRSFCEEYCSGTQAIWVPGGSQKHLELFLLSPSLCSKSSQLSSPSMVHIHTLVNGFIFHLTQESVLLRCVYILGLITVTQEVWTTAEFSGAGHANSHRENHHYVFWYSRYLLPHARCYLCFLKLCMLVSSQLMHIFYAFLSTYFLGKTKKQNKFQYFSE